MNRHKITNWENDMIAEPEEFVKQFAKRQYPNYDLEILSGLGHRDPQDLYDSLRDSRVIIIQPNLLEREQVVKLVSAISHPIHVNFNGATREWDIREFVFISVRPFDDLMQIKEWCAGVKDQWGEHALTKVLINCEAHFYGIANMEHYEMRCSRGGEITAIRHKDFTYKNTK